VLAQTIGTLSGGQRRRIELARILFADASEDGGGTLLLDEPTNHLDADSITWLRGFLSAHKGGLVVISHDANLLESVVNKVWYLDANRSTVDMYNLGWKAYLDQRETDERRRRRERANAEKKAGALMAQADKMRAKATKTVAAQNMARRAERHAVRAGGRPGRRQGRQGTVPDARPVRQDPADRAGTVQVVRLAGDLLRRRRGGRQGLTRSPSSASTAPARPRCCGSWPAARRRTRAR
jgi:ATPase subunit of ABC transporter with duplicated ATPase domains